MRGGDGDGGGDADGKGESGIVGGGVGEEGERALLGMYIQSGGPQGAAFPGRTS